MSGIPETKYAKSDGVHIAYQVFGEGEDLVFVPGWISHVECMWDIPPLAAFLRRLASFRRVLMIDKRGVGLSDPMPLDQPPTLEQRMDDVRAVMDAVGTQRATLLGISEGGPLNILFAATYPERTAALCLYGTFARLSRDERYDFGVRTEELESFLGMLAERWGDGVGLGALAPSLADDEPIRTAWARYQRLAASPATAVALLRMNAAIRDGVRAFGLEIRAGMHTGEVEVRGDDVGGIAVHLAARVLENAEPGQVLVSRTLTDLVAGSGLRFEDRGEHELKGVAEKWHLFAATT